jgi:hypothetical protein
LRGGALASQVARLLCAVMVLGFISSLLLLNCVLSFVKRRRGGGKRGAAVSVV